MKCYYWSQFEALDSFTAKKLLKSPPHWRTTCRMTWVWLIFKNEFNLRLFEGIRFRVRLSENSISWSKTYLRNLIGWKLTSCEFWKEKRSSKRIKYQESKLISLSFSFNQLTRDFKSNNGKLKTKKLSALVWNCVDK